jgi:hypothetical protein
VTVALVAMKHGGEGLVLATIMAGFIDDHGLCSWVNSLNTGFTSGIASFFPIAGFFRFVINTCP